jgi:hypothetical protein
MPARGMESQKVTDDLQINFHVGSMRAAAFFHMKESSFLGADRRSPAPLRMSACEVASRITGVARLVWTYIVRQHTK